MNVLVFITSHFPFGKKEAFIEGEFPFLNRSFDKIIIVSRNVSDEYIRKTSDSTILFRHNPSTSGVEWLRLPFTILLNLKRIITIYIEESKFRKSINRKLIWNQKGYLLKKILKATQLKDFIQKIVQNNSDPIDKIILYSYWFTTGADAICMVKGTNIVKRVCRTHRVDLYEDEAEFKYIPLIKFKHLMLDSIYFISYHGLEYFKMLTNILSQKLCVSNLGVTRIGPLPEISDGQITIVSCSSLIEVKRVHLIIEALERVDTKFKISWLHFGDGPLKSELESLAKSRIGQLINIDYVFKGHVSNNEIMDFYSSTDVNIFLNVSSSEGIPVSIMEAQAFGIPVIATDVGGISEIINRATGKLIPINFKTDYIVSIIEHYISRNISERKKLRDRIVENWESNYNSIHNYGSFVSNILKI